MTHYVAGLMFSHDRESVALIRKQKPEWQKGLLNGIGGKIEAGETPLQAMAREFEEETGMPTDTGVWQPFTRLQCREWVVDFYASSGDVAQLRSMEAEKVEIVRLKDITPIRRDMVENLCWLVALALDSITDGRPFAVSVTYPD